MNTEPAPEHVSQQTGGLKNMMARTSGAFTAEYTVFLMLWGGVVSTTVWLAYIFFALVVGAMQGVASGYNTLYMFVLWLLVSALITVPLAGILSKRIRGEVDANPDWHGELPKGAAKGFRTFWIVAVSVTAILMVTAAIYTPIMAAISGSGFPESLVGVTLPALVSVAVIVASVYTVTRSSHDRQKAQRLAVGIVGLLVVLVIVDLVWALALKNSTPPAPTYPTTPTYSDPYLNRYNSTIDY